MGGTTIGRPAGARNNRRPAGNQLPLFPGRRRARSARAGAASSPSSSSFPAVPGPAAALGNTRNTFPPLAPDAIARGQRRARRRLLRDVLWHKSSLARCRSCGRVPIATGVSMVGNSGVAHYRGLASCGSIWSCPVCSAKIRNVRAQEIAAAAANWHRAGGTVVMATFTFPHDVEMRLAPLLKLVARSFSSVIAGRPWQRLKARVPVAGQIRSIEVTRGPAGWHPHIHALLFCDGDIGAEGLAGLARYLRDRWSRFITRAGYRPPSELHGVKVDVCTSAAEAGLYISKTQDGRSPGNELARADLKSGRAGRMTPFELLGTIADTGDLELLPVWLEYEKATKGHQAITWSNGLRRLVGAGPERTNQEVAAEEVGGDLVLEFSSQAWRQVTRCLQLETRLLEAWESGGEAAVIALAAAHGLFPDPEPPGPVPRLVRRALKYS